MHLVPRFFGGINKKRIIIPARYVSEELCTFRIDQYSFAIVGAVDAMNSAIAWKIPYPKGSNLKLCKGEYVWLSKITVTKSARKK